MHRRRFLSLATSTLPALAALAALGCRDDDAGLGPVVVPDGALDLRDFGAVGDGRSDDAGAFVLALEEARTSGRPLFVPRASRAWLLGAPLELAGVTIVGEGELSRIVAAGALALRIAGDVTLRGLRVEAAARTAGARAIDNPAGRVLAEDVRFVAAQNVAGNVGASRYARCTFESWNSVVGTTAWSGDSAFDDCDFVGTNGVDVQGGRFTGCRMRGGGAGLTDGQGWGVHMPLGTAAVPPVFDRCDVRGDGAKAYGMGLGDAGVCTVVDSVVRGARWGIYVRSRSSVTAERTSIAGGVAGFELDRLPASAGPRAGIDKFGDTDSVLRQCCLHATLGFDVIVPADDGLGHVVLDGTAAGRIGVRARDAGALSAEGTPAAVVRTGASNGRC